ncbi:GNAT family N-acetyltransferase [Streptococcus caprae]|uniref:GNAT family N-acetyltransferase n=1 Tax=Streptococcus caprae TaxID=1640501 RepID=A0ABV8CXY0_9STRE
MHITSIQTSEDAAVAGLIRQSLEAEGLAIPGTAYFDPQLDHLTSYYADLDRSAYFIGKVDGQVVACGGFGPVTDEICELQKLYVDVAFRRQGLARQLLEVIEDAARQSGYSQIYLETTGRLEAAHQLYQQCGYSQLSKPIANDAGHHSMDLWMIKDL